MLNYLTDGVDSTSSDGVDGVDLTTSNDVDGVNRWC
jgi:hypothetical protein